jgi:sialate O-acetylesterase
MPKTTRIVFHSAFLAGITLFLSQFTALATVAVPGIFSSHMVVQREMAVPIWGTAAANEKVTVKLGTQQADFTTGSDGKWKVNIPSQPAGGPFDLTITGTNTLTLTDVYVGEVWVGSGQSNMDYRVNCTFSGCEMNNEAAEIAAANYPLIRSINIEFKPNAKPTAAMTTQKWMVCSPTTVGGFSAAGYFFSRELHKSIPNVAIGLVHSSYGASTMECWMSREALMGIPSVSSLVTQFEGNSPDYTDQHNPYVCYNGQINPIIPYAIRGVIWYQGESLKWSESTYRDLQVGIIDSWRKAWGQDFTFIIAQLANHGIAREIWPFLREAQLQASQMVANTGLVVNIDIGDSVNVHPPDKQDLGLRFGLAARGITYKHQVAFSGPIFDRMVVEASSIRLFFNYTVGGLELKGGNAKTFEIAGSNGTFYPATAKVDKDSTVVVSSASVTTPVHARYAWAGFPHASLYNKATPALPASPFRTNAPATPPTFIGKASETQKLPLLFQVEPYGKTGKVRLNYYLNNPALVSLELLNIRGHKWLLDSGLKPMGRHTLELNLKDGDRALKGHYMVCLKAGNQEKTLSLFLDAR